MNTFGFKLVASAALKIKYGFGPAPDQVTLLESDGDGNYILFRVGEHEYRYEDDEITNIEEQKKNDEAVEFFCERAKKDHKDKAIAEEKMEALKDECRRLREALDTDEESLQAMRGANKDLKEANKCLTDQVEELKKTLHYREMALDQAAAKREELETKNRQLCNDLAGERLMVRNLETQLEERAAEHAAVEAARRTATYRAARLEN